MIAEINPHLKNYRFILASQSPRRRELLEQFGMEFSTQVRPVDESFPESMSPSEAAEYLAQKKGNAFKQKELPEKTMVITADTVVAIDGEILGKPSNQAHARQMLKKLSGKPHEVITGVLLKTAGREVVFSATTNVYFKNLSLAEIDFYIREFKPFDKAGAYGIQEWIGFAAIEHIEGSYFNVVGLPVHALYQKLAEWQG